MADPLAIVSVAEVKTALRIVGDDTDHDQLLTGYIKAAVGWIEEQTELALTSDSFAADQVPAIIRAAVHLLVRDMYDLREDWPKNSAVRVWIAPYIKY